MHLQLKEADPLYSADSTKNAGLHRRVYDHVLLHLLNLPMLRNDPILLALNLTLLKILQSLGRHFLQHPKESLPKTPYFHCRKQKYPLRLHLLQLARWVHNDGHLHSLRPSVKHPLDLLLLL